MPIVSLPPFDFQRLVGSGGMGAVFLATDRRTGAARAIKLLRPELSQDRSLRARFLREARTASALQHAHIAKVYEVGEFVVDASQIESLGLDATAGHAIGHGLQADEGTFRLPYLAMEWVEGDDLGALIGRELGLEELVGIGEQILAALDAAHRQGVVHRDLKPANILLTRARQVRLLDFGLAKILSSGVDTETTSQLTLDGTVMGTVPYLAPEQLQDLSVGPRADLFAFGVLLYELIAGVTPFSSKNVVEFARSLLLGQPRPLVEAAPATPPWLHQLIHELIAFDPEDRPASAGEVRRRLLAGSGRSTASMSASEVSASEVSASEVSAPVQSRSQVSPSVPAEPVPATRAIQALEAANTSSLQPVLMVAMVLLVIAIVIVAATLLGN